MRSRLGFCVLVVIVSSFLSAGQDPQQPRPQQKDSRGLLKINEMYYDMAAATGGDFYFWAPGEFASVAPIDVPTSGEDVVLAYGALESEGVFEIPVEGGARELTVFCGIQRKDLALLVRPDGSLVRDGEPGVKVQSFQHMTIVTVTSPAPGVWRLELNGAGVYSISAKVNPGRDAPSLDSFAFVEKGGRPGHEGLFPIKRAPRSGETLMAKAAMSGGRSRAELTLVARDGTLLVSCPSEARDGDLLGRCTVPTSAFRAVLTGVDSVGLPFRRITSGLVTPE